MPEPRLYAHQMCNTEIFKLKHGVMNILNKASIACFG